MQQIADFALPCDTLADLGTDHALLPIYAVTSKLAARAIASDINEGPLARAADNVNAYGLIGQIDLRLGDGLRTLQYGEADVIVSAGIGGHVHMQMVTQSIDIARSARRLVFQPMNAGHVLREALYDLDFHIIHEATVAEEDKLYEVIAVEPGDGKDRIYAETAPFLTALDAAMSVSECRRLQFVYGPTLLANPTPLMRRRVAREVESLSRIVGALRQSDRPASANRRQSLERDIAILSAWLGKGEVEYE